MSESEPPPTQSSTPSNRTYVSVFLFEYNVNKECPFSSVSVDNFKDSDFPFYLLSQQLSLEDRLKARTLSRLPGSTFCVFAKCEEGRRGMFFLLCYETSSNIYLIGTTAKRRNAEIKRLNDLYLEILPVKQTLQKCLKYMCQTEPNRMLRDWTYEMIAEPLTREHGSNDSDVCFLY